MEKIEDMENRNNHKNQKTVKTDSAFFSESLKSLKSLMQIFIESAKSAKSIFATFATFASANFVGKASCERTMRYGVRSRIPSFLFRYSLDPNLSRSRSACAPRTPSLFKDKSQLSFPSLVSLICLCMLTVGVGNAWADSSYTLGWGSATGASGTYTNFTDVSGSVTGICSFSTAKNGANSVPAYNSGNSELRLYNGIKNGSTTNGGSITITPASGVTITGFTITAATNPTTKYKVGTGDLTTLSLNGTTTYTGSATGLSATNSSPLFIQDCNSSNQQLKIKTIVITYTASSATLTVSGGATSLAIGDSKVNGSGKTNSTLSFSGSNLSANATLAISGTNASMFSVSPTSVTPSTGTISNQTITVTYSPTAAGDHTATLTISSTGATSKEITLTGTGKYEVIWQNNGGDYTTTLVASGSKPTFPDAPTSCDTGEGASTTFYGWSTGTWGGKINSLAGKTIYTSAASMPTVSTNGTTYHAVFCKGGALTYATSIAANDVVYLATSTSSGASGVTGANVNGKDATVSTTQANWMPFTVQTNSTGWKLQNGTNYIQATAKNFAFTESTPNILTFVQDGSTGKYRMIFTVASGSDAGTYALSENAGSYWRFYKTSNSYTWYYVVKASAGTNYMTNCCTALASINGSVSWSNGTSATLTWDKMSNVAALTPYTITCKQTGGSSAGSVGSVDLTGSKATCTITGLTAGNSYDFKIAVSAASGYCDKDSTITSRAPKITTTTDENLVDVTYAEGDGPSTNASYFTFSGVGLTGDITVTAPTNFQVSKTSSSSGFGSSVTVSPSTGSITDQKIWICLASGLTNASSPYGGNVALSGGGAATVNVAITGTVSSACTVPTVETPTLASIASGTITVSCASITVDDNCDLSEYGFVWKASSDPTASDNKNAIATTYADNFSKALSISFTTGNAYNIKAFGTNSAGTTLSSTLTVTPQSVAFNMNGHGSQVATQYINNGSKASEPSAPSASYYTFNGWKLSGSAYNFSTATVTSDITLDADWSVIPVTALTLNYSTLKKYVGESSVTLSVASVTPGTANPAVTWSSSDATVASVDDGVVSFLKAGTATITATSTVSGGVTATCSVEVRSISSPTMQDEDGTTISGSGLSATWTLGTRTLTASEGTSKYKFKRWIVTNATPASTTNLSTTLGDPTGNVTVIAEFYKPRVVKWSVNGNDSYNTGSPTTTVAYNGTISTVPTDPSGLACAGTFIAWTDATHNNGQTAKDDDSYYEDALYTDAGDFPNITAATTTFYAVFAEGGEAAVNTTMWSENWTGVTSGKKPSEYDGTGRAVYNSGTVTYTESGSDCNVKADSYAGGSSPELYIKGGEWWNIANIPTGGAATLTLTYMSNNDADVTTTTKNVAVGTTSSSGNSRSRTITISGDVSYFDLKFAKSGGNTRVDNILLKVASVSLTDYVTECDPNIVKVTYNANSGTTSCTNTTTNKTEDFTICSSVPTRDYYTFAGWLCSADSKTYAANATIDDAAINGDFTLTAQWTPVPYDITYELDGGTNSGSNPATYNVTTTTITLQNPTRDHDRFDGWYDNGSFTGDAVTSIPLGSHGDITLYAKWAERHHIEFFKEGVSVGEIWRADDENMEDAVAGQGSVPIDPSAPTACSSKVFVGWTTNDDYDSDTRPTDLMKPAAGSVDADKEYHAVWATSTSGSKTLVMEITRADFDDSYHSGAEQSHTSTAVANDGSGATLSVSWKSVNVGDFSSKIQVKDASGTGFWNTTDLGSISSVSITTGNNITHFENTSVHPTSTSGTTKGYFTVTKSGGTGTATKVTVTFTKTVSYYIAYSTSCCTKYDITGASTSGTAVEVNGKTGGTLTSSHNSRCAGKNVTLSAAVNTGYQFNGWTITGTTSGDDLTNLLDDATSLTPAAFEMPSEGITVEADISEQVVTAWSWTEHVGGGAVSNPLVVYVGQKVQLDVTYTPSTIINAHKSYTRTHGSGDNTYITTTIAQNYCTVKGNRATAAETLTLRHNDDPSGNFVKVVNVEVRALPTDKFLDLVHGVVFDNQSATLANSDYDVIFTYTAPGEDQSEWSSSYANTCEQKKVKLVGWVESEYADACIAADSFPTTNALKADSEHFFEVGTEMTASNKTFYAVWAEVK